MKTLITILALFPSIAFAGAGLEAEYIFDGGASQSVGGYINLTKEFGPFTVGPQVSGGVIDPGSFGQGEMSIYGDASLIASVGKKLSINGEVGYEYIHASSGAYNDMFVSAGLSFPLGTTLEVFSDVKWRGDKFDNRTIGAGVKLAF